MQMNHDLLGKCRTLFMRFFSGCIPVWALAFRTDSRMFFFISWDPFVSASFAFESFDSDFDFPHLYEVYYSLIYKYLVYYKKIFKYL